MTDVTIIAESLHKQKMFSYFAIDDLIELCKAGEIISCPEGSTLIEEGDHSQEFYLIISGCVNVMVEEKEKSVFICTIGAGEVFGEAGIFSRVRRTASVVAAEDSAVLCLKRDRFLKFIRSRPTQGVKLLLIIIYSLLSKLRQANQELAFERKFDINQDDVDDIIRGIMEE